MTLAKTSPKHVHIEAARCKKILEGFLLGSSIVGIEYLRTGWNISFCIAEEREASLAEFVEHPFEVLLQTCEIKPPDPAVWESALSGTPTDVVSLPDHHDAITALILFNAVAYKVVGVEMRESSAIEIEFTGGRKLLVSGKCDPVDEVWTLAPQVVAGRRAFGDPAFVQSYFGDLSADPRLV